MTKSRHLGFRLLAAALCLVCLLCTASPLAVIAAEDVQERSLTTLVRYKAYTTSPVIGQIEDGTEIKVLGETKAFYKVDCYDMVGYIAKEQIVHTEEDKYYVNCQEGSPETSAITYTDHTEALYLRHRLYELAKKQLGSRYVYGANRPGAFDCSGLTWYLYAQYGIEIHRTASTQMQDGIVVAKQGLQVGDLIFFREPGEYTVASHVGIYVGKNQIIHSGSKGVVFSSLEDDYFSDYYLCARRIVITDDANPHPQDPMAAPTAIPTAVGRRTR